jgi:hypothetical protein
MKALVVLALGAGAALGAQHAARTSTGSPAAGPAAVTQSTAGTSSASTSTAPRSSSALTSLPNDVTSSDTGLDRTSLRNQRPIASRLADRYQTAATQVATLESSGNGSPQLLQLVVALRSVAAAYRDAARSAGKGDVSGYMRAGSEIVQARRAVRQVIGALGASGGDRAGGGGGGARAGSGGGSNSGVGDSRSDDPSDDQPNN